MTSTFKHLITKYAAEVTGKSESYFIDWFEQRDDNYLDYILYSSVPSDYTYDGVKEFFIREENEQRMSLVCTF